MAAFPWTDDLDQQLRDLAATGTSVRAMAEKIGCSKSVVDRRLKHLGIELDRTATAAATAANALDAKARRSRIIVRLYDEVEALLTDVEKGRTGQGWNTVMRGGMGTEEARTLDFIPTRDRRDATDVINRHLDRAVKLEQVDSGTGQAQVVGLLQATAAALGLTDAQDTQP